jgi:hypothetical protein
MDLKASVDLMSAFRAGCTGLQQCWLRKKAWFLNLSGEYELEDVFRVGNLSAFSNVPRIRTKRVFPVTVYRKFFKENCKF